MRWLLVGVMGLALLTLPGVGAQQAVPVLVDRAEEKTDQATGDPEGFAREHASSEGAGGEARWAVAWSCLAIDEAGDPVDVEPPRPEACRDYEDALGIEPENAAEPEAQVEPLAEGPVAEAERLVEDVEDAVTKVLEDPESAVEVGLRLAGRAVEALVAIVEDALGLAGDGAKVPVEAAAGLGAVAADAGDGLVDAALTVASLPVRGAEALGDGAEAALEASWSAASAATQIVGQAVSDLWHGLGGSVEQDGPRQADADLGEATGRAEGLLPEVDLSGLGLSAKA